MNQGNSLRLIATIAITAPLAACGGGGGGSGSNIVSTPTPPPPAPPTFTPFLPKVFPSVTANTDFTALGYEVFSGVGGASPPELRDGFSVRYDSAAQAYVIDLPSASPGRFQATSEDSFEWHGVLLDSSAPALTVNVRKPGTAAADFVYTTFGDYYQYEWAPIEFYSGVFAFGQATPAGAVPTTGTASYNAILHGTTLDWARVVGSATLQFNFAAGTLSGSMNPEVIGGLDAISLGRYDFVNTIYSVGSTNFSGGLRHESGNLTGSFNGLFTGPAAQELMARWRAQYIMPGGNGTTSEMVGVLVGRRP